MCLAFLYSYYSFPDTGIAYSYCLRYGSTFLLTYNILLGSSKTSLLYRGYLNVCWNCLMCCGSRYTNSVLFFTMNLISDLSIKMPQCSLQSCRRMRNLYRFPVDEAVREKWILFCDRPSGWSPGPGARICGAHFAQCSFASLRRIYLKSGAVPTIRGRSLSKNFIC